MVCPCCPRQVTTFAACLMPRVVLCYDDVHRSMIMGMYVTYLYWYLYAPSLPSFLSLPPSSQLTLTPLATGVSGEGGGVGCSERWPALGTIVAGPSWPCRSFSSLPCSRLLTVAVFGDTCLCVCPFPVRRACACVRPSVRPSVVLSAYTPLFL